MSITLDAPGREVLLMGNEAIARGAIEAGVAFCSAYPGTPSSEILGVLAEAAPKLGFYAEWSTNEIVAMEAAAAAAFSGLRAMCSMKSQGLSVCADFLTTLNLSGTKGGLVIVVCDDPAALSSVNEIDTRSYAEIADLPLFEPATVQEAKDMTKFAFELSEELCEPCIVRSVTRISHGRGNVRLGEISKERRAAELSERFITGLATSAVERHAGLHAKLRAAAEKFESSPFNFYYGDPNAAFLIITSGAGWLYSKEAFQILGLDEGFGILKLGTTHPLPRRLVASHLKHAVEIMVIEETDPFIERKVKALAVDLRLDICVYGRELGSERAFADAVGEMSVDAVIEALRQVKKLSVAGLRNAEYEKEAEEALKILPKREIAFCPGCPHRASLFAIKTAIKLDGRDVPVCGDIGCYTLGMFRTGFYLSKTSHCMGAAIGLSSGFRSLKKPVIALAGDSTFFHACVPGLINAKYNNANVLYILLDNGATAMTGFQPHPGVGTNAMGEPAPTVRLEEVCKGIGVPVRICDPFDVDDAVRAVYELLQQQGGTRVLIFRHTCGIIETKQRGKRKAYVVEEKCIGEDCGCNRFCSRVFNCPGIVWDKEKGKARIDEVVCTGCGVCAKLCPAGAIIVEEETYTG